MIIYVARHGQSTSDIENLYGGDYDDHLTDEGNGQAAELAGQLDGQGIEKLFASPKIRAQETATAIGNVLGLEVVTIDEFRERNNYGILTGMNKDEAAVKHPEEVELLKDPHNAIEGAEEYEPFRLRIEQALKSVSETEAEKVAVVTHGGPLRIIFREILKIGEIEFEDCSYAVLEANDGAYSLIDTSGITISS